jgi:DNA polymerase III alpha subunit
VETLVEQTKSMGIRALALTDINNTMGMIGFWRSWGNKIH